MKSILNQKYIFFRKRGDASRPGFRRFFAQAEIFKNERRR